MTADNGGAIVGEVLRRQGVQFLFTLCGGHISPILVESRARGIRVVDMRDEKNAVFAADATARMTGIPGVAAVTAGPGVTNTITAVKNAQMAQSPLVLIGGAAATILKGRGSLQDIDQLSIMKPITRWAATVKTRAAIEPTLERAFHEARTGVPGPVFVELPIDLLYSEALVREWYLKESGVQNAEHLGARLMKLYLEGHLYRQFKAPALPVQLHAPELRVPSLSEVAAHLPPPQTAVASKLRDVATLVSEAKRPVLVVGSQALVNERDPSRLARAIERLGVPTFLGGTARGLLGRQHELQFRHARGKALKEADLVIVAGFPFDFRLGYGRAISGKATLVAANLSAVDLRKNRRPEIALQMHPGEFLMELGALVDPYDGASGSARQRPGPLSDSEPGRGSGPDTGAGSYSGEAGPRSSRRWADWFEVCLGRERARDEEIERMGAEKTDLVHPVDFFLRLERKMAEDAVLVVDGGDFVATAAYIVRPRAPLSWLDPGVFGTLGVGGGFAVGAALCKPGKEVWLLYGDGSSAYSLAEFDTFARHGLAPIAVVGNDGSWGQIARDQVELLGDAIGTVLNRSAYHLVAEGYGGKGLLLSDPSKIDETIDEAKALARSGVPVCINVHIAKSEFRKGSISM